MPTYTCRACKHWREYERLQHRAACCHLEKGASIREYWKRCICQRRVAANVEVPSHSCQRWEIQDRKGWIAVDVERLLWLRACQHGHAHIQQISIVAYSDIFDVGKNWQRDPCNCRRGPVQDGIDLCVSWYRWEQWVAEISAVVDWAWNISL